jgi:hypothetical protein
MFFHPSTNSPAHFCGQNEHIPWISLVAKAIPPEFQPSPTSESKPTFPGARTVPPIKKRSFAEREQSGHLFLTRPQTPQTRNLEWTQLQLAVFLNL